MDECQGYGNAMIPGNETYQALKQLKTVSFGWEWGVKAAKEGWAEQWRKVIGAE